MKVIVIGGSIAGLMHAVVLKSMGHDVHILEVREPQALVNQAAGLSLGPQAQEFIKLYGLEALEYCTRSNVTQFLGKDSEVESEIALALVLETTSWGLLYGKLRAKFDLDEPNAGKSTYEDSQRVIDVQDDGANIIVITQNVRDSTERTMTADFVIAADGGRSLVRSKLDPSINQTYAGYLAWRGDVGEGDVPGELKGVYDDKMIFSRSDNSYILAYLTPDEGGSIAPGRRRFEWTWFDYCDEKSPEFARIMTDSKGKRHHRVVPKGVLDQSVWEERLGRAHRILPEPWARVVNQSRYPFATAVMNSEATKAIHFNSKLLIVGDALMQFRPHMGMACNFAAVQALGLAQVFRKEKTLEQWEKDVIAYGEEFAYRSIAFGTYAFTSKFPEGYQTLGTLKEGKSSML